MTMNFFGRESVKDEPEVIPPHVIEARMRAGGGGGGGGGVMVRTHAEDRAALAESARPARLPSAPKRLTPMIDCNVMTEAHLAEYREVAETVGVSAADIMVEEFRLFLAKHDIPSFSLAEVISYMDDLVKKDNPQGFGWHWCPVRARDAEVGMTFGRPSVDDRRMTENGKVSVASDFYESHRFQNWHQYGRSGWVQVVGSNGNSQMHAPSPPDWRTLPSPAYTRTIPLHALKKIALIERDFGIDKAVFLVTDYTTAPHIVVNPDPFLMAVIPNSAVAHGKGRFIIDVWDEPGFGIDRMVK